jgi:hypothetical protein
MAGFFTPGGFDDPSLPVNSALRQRIALAMLSAKKGYPKTLGEGLTAIGDALGDRSLMRRLSEADVADQREAMGAPAVPGAPQPQAAYSPGDATRSAYADERPAEPPARAETPLYTAPSQPSSMLASATPSGLTAPQPTLRDLRTDQTAEGAGAGASPSRSSPAASTSAGSDTPMQYEGDGYNPLDQASDLRDQRKPYVAQLNANPAAKLKMAGLMSAEEGTGKANSTARQALAETIFNRGVSRGYGNVGQVMDPRYYQPMHDKSGNYAAHVARLQSDPNYRAQVFSEIDRVGGEGTNVSNLATDNASGDVAQRSMGNQTLAYAAPNQESFFRKDVRPDVHGAGVVPATAAWAQRLATAPPVDPRAGVAQAMLAQNASQRPPVMNADDQQAALPPVQRQMAPQAAPPQMQIAQAPPPGQPTPTPGYVMPAEREPQPPAMIQPSREEYELNRKVQAMAMRNPYALTGKDAQDLALMKQSREYEQAKQNEVFKEQLAAFRAKELERQKQLADQAKRTSDYNKQEFELRTAKDKEALSQRLGGRDTEKFLLEFKPQMVAAQQSENVIRQAGLARDAIKAGVITGFGASSRIDTAKLKAWMFNNKRAGDEASNTEQLQAALTSMMNVGLTNLQGTTRTNISDTDVKIAMGMIGADPRLQQQAIDKIIASNESVARNNLNDFEDKRHYYLSGTRLERDFNFPTKPSAPDKYIDVLLKNNDEDTRKEFDDRFGKGAAELEIARAKRAKMRGGP